MVEFPLQLNWSNRRILTNDMHPQTEGSQDNGEEKLVREVPILFLFYLQRLSVFLAGYSTVFKIVS